MVNPPKMMKPKPNGAKKGKKSVKVDAELNIPFLGKQKVKVDTRRARSAYQNANNRNQISLAQGTNGVPRKTLLSEPMRTVLGPIELSGAGAATGDVLLNGLFTPNIADTRLINQARTWQQYRFVNAKIVYDPVVSQLTPGQIGLFVTSDPMDVLVARDADVLNVVTEHGGALVPVGKPRSIPLPKHNSNYYYIDEEGPDPRLIYQGQYFVVACSPLSTEGGLPLGTLYMEYQVEWSSQQIQGVVDEVPGSEYLSEALSTGWTITTFDEYQELGGTWTPFQHTEIPMWVLAQDGASYHLTPGVYDIDVHISPGVTYAAAGDALSANLRIFTGATAGALTDDWYDAAHTFQCITNGLTEYSSIDLNAKLLIENPEGLWVTPAIQMTLLTVNSPTNAALTGTDSTGAAQNFIQIERLGPYTSENSVLMRRRVERILEKAGFNVPKHNDVKKFSKNQKIECKSSRIKAAKEKTEEKKDLVDFKLISSGTKIDGNTVRKRI